jgi:hypothetical protein
MALTVDTPAFKPSISETISTDGRRTPASDRVAAVFLTALLTGYMFGDKGFAYLHVPGTPLFVGEIGLAVVGLYLVRRYRITDSRLRSPGRFALAVFLVYSASRTIPFIGEYGVNALRDAAVWYYGIFAFFVADYVTRRGIEPTVAWLRRVVPWFLLWAPISMALDEIFREAPLVPDSTVSVFSHRSANTSVMIAACVGFLWLLGETETGVSRIRRGFMTAVAGLALVGSGIQNRGGFLAAACGLGVVWWFARSEQRNFAGLLAATVLLVGLFFWSADLRISFYANNRVISADQFVRNLISVVNPSAVATAGDLVGNTSWRIELWTDVLQDINLNAPVLGRGYGVSLGEFYGFEGFDQTELRSAHNSHMTIFGRSGYLGISLWILLWVTWFALVTRARLALFARGLRREAGLAVATMAFVVATHVNAVFDPSMEGPPVSYWLWSAYGLGLGLTALSRRSPFPQPEINFQTGKYFQN